MENITELKHFENMKQKDLANLETGEYFTYRIDTPLKTIYKKGLKINPCYMIPIGLICNTIEQAQKQY